VRQYGRQDRPVRYGREEFVILRQETPLNDIAVALTRWQRELTRKIFMNKKILIAFGAGIAEIFVDATADVATRRSGGNRVVTA